MKNKQINKNLNRKLTTLQVHLPWIWGEQKSTNKKKKKKATLRINNHKSTLTKVYGFNSHSKFKVVPDLYYPYVHGRITFLIKEWTPHIPNSTNEFKTNKKLPQEVYIETTN